MLSFRLTPEIEAFAASGTCRESAPMKYLYSSDSDIDLREIITNLTFVRLMQEEPLIIPEDDAQWARASDANIWKPMMADYVSFVCLVNPNFHSECFADLFSKSAVYYQDHLKSLIDDFAMDYENWKKSFVGSLFI